MAIATTAVVVHGCMLKTPGELRPGWDGQVTVDTDGDGVPDDQPDNCPDTSNRSQADFDGDGIGNACDPDAEGVDSDGDGIDDAIDRCSGDRSGTNEDRDVYPLVPQQIVDDCDDCPSVPDPDQANADLDDIGDACEPPDGSGSMANLIFFDRLRDDLMGWRILDLGGWSFEAGEMVAAPDPSLQALVPDEVMERAGTRFAVDAWVRISPGTAGVPARAGIIVASELDAGKTRLVSWYACALDAGAVPGGEMHLVLATLPPGCTGGSCSEGTVLRDEATGVAFDPVLSYRIYALRDGNSVSCWLAESAASVQASLSMTPASLPAGGPGLLAAGAGTGAAFLNAAVYGP